MPVLFFPLPVLVTKLKSSQSVQSCDMNDDFIVFFSRTVMLYGDIRTEMVEHKIRLLTPAVNHIGHVDNTAGED